MAKGFWELELSFGNGESSLFLFEFAERVAIRARDFGVESASLLFEESSKSSLGKSLCGSGGELFHLLEVEFETSIGIVVGGSLGDNFSPGNGQLAELLELFWCEFAFGHGQSCLPLTVNSGSVFLLPCYHTAIRMTNRVLASTSIESNILIRHDSGTVVECGTACV